MPNSWLSSFREKLVKLFSKFYFLKLFVRRPPLATVFNFKDKNGFDKQNDFDQKLVDSMVKTKKRWPRLRNFKYLSQILSPQEKTRLNFFLTIFILALLGFGLNVYFTGTNIVPRSGGSYTEALVGSPKLINPLYASLNQVDQDLTILIYSGLVKVDKDKNIVPDLAENWTISDDQKTYTFVLKTGLKWHDGEPLGINDILFTFKAIQNSEYKSPLSVNFSDVEIKIIDEQTIEFNLQEPYTPFLENLTVGILPAHLWQEVVPANVLLADYNLKPIGSGPYKFKSLTKDKLGNIKSYNLTSYLRYQPHAAYIEELIFKFYPDFNSAVEALKNHNVAGISYLPKEFRDELNLRKDVIQYSLQLPQYTALFFNQANNKALQDLQVRQALAYALNKEELVSETLQTEGQVIDAPILPGFIGYNPNIAKYNFDLVQAQKLLDAAGYQLPENDSTRVKDDSELKLILTTVNNKENFAIAQVIQKMWQQAGIKTEINLVESGLIKSEVIKNRSFEILLFGEIVGIDPDPYPFWHSSQAGEAGLNLSNFVNREADQVLEEARQISDPQQRHDKYVHFQNILNQNLPAIFLYTPKYLYPVSEDIKGLDTQNISTPSDRFTNIANWYLKTKRSLKEINLFK